MIEKLKFKSRRLSGVLMVVAALAVGSGVATAAPVPQPEGIFAGAGQTGDATSNINPDDIESISALTGPSAAALYGANAANVVINIILAG